MLDTNIYCANEYYANIFMIFDAIASAAIPETYYFIPRMWVFVIILNADGTLLEDMEMSSVAQDCQSHPI